MDSGNEYVVQVKNNQPTLLHYAGLMSIISNPIDTIETKNKGRGRYENRDIEVYEVNEDIPEGWVGIKRVIKVTRYGSRDHKIYYNVNYYISSLEQDKAAIFARGIRSHWSIENNLHWVKDKTQNEDKSLVRKKRTAANLSAFRQININIYRLKGCYSLKKAYEKYSNRIKEGLLIMNKLHIDYFRTV